MISYYSRIIISPGASSPAIDIFDPYTNQVVQTIRDQVRPQTKGGVMLLGYNGTISNTIRTNYAQTLAYGAITGGAFTDYSYLPHDIVRRIWVAYLILIA
jgi:hypothetical protein